MTPPQTPDPPVILREPHSKFSAQGPEFLATPLLAPIDLHSAASSQTHLLTLYLTHKGSSAAVELDSSWPPAGPVIMVAIPVVSAPKSLPKMAAVPESRPKMATIPESHPKMAAIPESLLKTAASSESLLKMDANPEPLYKMAVTPEPPAIMEIKPLHRCHSSFGRPTAGFSQSSRHPKGHSTGCHRDCSSFLSAPFPESDPEPAPVCESNPEPIPVHKSTPALPDVAAPTAEPLKSVVLAPPEVAVPAAEPLKLAASTSAPPEVAASNAEPPESAASTSELSACPVTFKETIYKLSACPVMAKEAVS
ncbi:Translation initiation factor IF-2 [Labeo rohita]|uniref:Translation initiation factor IF-2 n=1 Tax=Labeo rohita TaxID=84645 RepID=A0ABQ8LH37_LABRO|nr:Translation initiation factor IF-2 [Labeo rohita]